MKHTTEQPAPAHVEPEATTTALVQHTAAADDPHPANGGLDIASAVWRWNTIKEFTHTVLKEGVDYGAIPGAAGDKKVLWKSGAEKLCALFNFAVSLEAVSVLEDWDKGLFYYRYRATITQAGVIIADSEGSCNSREKKYRYRKAERLCPECNQPTVIKGKEEYGGGWLCWKKPGGCGAKFPAGDKRITGQEAGLVENPEPYELVNTIQKMAQKRAMVAAVLIAVGASELFTQDLEDTVTVEHTLPDGKGHSEPPEALPVEAYDERATPDRAEAKKPRKVRGPLSGAKLVIALDKKARGLLDTGPIPDDQHPTLQQWGEVVWRIIRAVRGVTGLNDPGGPCPDYGQRGGSTGLTGELEDEDFARAVFQGIFPEIFPRVTVWAAAVWAWARPLIDAGSSGSPTAEVVEAELHNLVEFLYVEGALDWALPEDERTTHKHTEAGHEV